MSIKDWPEDDRPREKLLAKGADALSDAELVAIFLRTGTRGLSALDVARQLLDRFGSIRGLLTAEPQTLSSAPGMGQARCATLQAILELSRRHFSQLSTRGSSLTTPGHTAEFLRLRLRDLPYEVFCSLFLDNRHRIIAFEELFRGTIDGTQVHCREVAKRALAHNAAAMIVAHNHPSGVAEPSHADQLITRRLKAALDLIGVRLLDHIVVGDADCVSLAELGMV